MSTQDLINLQDFCKTHGLFEPHEGVIRLPHLIQGNLVLPPPLSEAHKGRLLNWEGKKYLLPALEPRSLLGAKVPHGEKKAQVQHLLLAWKEALEANQEFLAQVAQVAGDSFGLGKEFTLKSFMALAQELSPQEALQITEEEIGWKYLEGWQNEPNSIRAFGTRQLHICAGNAPPIVWISTLRMVLSLGCGVIKIPHQGLESGALLALASALILPQHPLIQGLSVVYWPGGNPEVEDYLFLPFQFDRVVVWGGPETVAKVSQKITTGRLVVFGPRYSVAILGQGQFSSDVCQRLAKDSLIYNQQACNAPLVHYVIGDAQRAKDYASQLSQALALWDKTHPIVPNVGSWGALIRLKRGLLRWATWFPETLDSASSAVVVCTDEFDLLTHPGHRLVVVRPISNLKEALSYITPGVSVATVWPEELRLDLRDDLASRGVASILPLGEANKTFPGAPQDGMRVLQELVDWKQG